MIDEAVAFDLEAQRLRCDFPALARADRPPLVYLDSAATAQKPASVIEAVAGYYREGVANVQRGVHALGRRATEAHEGARAAVQRLLHAAQDREIVLTSGCTAAINLVAYAYGDSHVGPGDDVIVTQLEHHGNLLPWQRLCERRGARLRILPLTDAGEPRLDLLEAWLGPRCRLVAVAHVSNVTGAVINVREVVRLAGRVGARVLVDGAQAAPRMPVDVRELGCDFYVLAGHKLYGPAGIGALYARRDALASMPPFFTGGGIVDEVAAESATYAAAPQRFEPGTPNVEGAVGLTAAVEYLEAAGTGWVLQHEAALTRYARAALTRTRGVELIGAPASPLGVVSFVMGDVHPHDVGTILDSRGVAVRVGHHCATLALQHFGVPATVRASFGLYNTRADIDALVAALAAVREVFAA